MKVLIIPDYELVLSELEFDPYAQITLNYMV